MDGRTFLNSARHLLTVSSEANRRSAGGPIYSALLNEARDALERWGYPVPANAMVYDFVFAHFHNVLNLELLRVANALSQIEHYRNDADDCRNRQAIFDDEKEAKRLLVLAEVTIDLLDQIEADPARRAVAIADLRTVFP